MSCQSSPDGSINHDFDDTISDSGVKSVNSNQSKVFDPYDELNNEENIEKSPSISSESSNDDENFGYDSSSDDGIAEHFQEPSVAQNNYFLPSRVSMGPSDHFEIKNYYKKDEIDICQNYLVELKTQVDIMQLKLDKIIKIDFSKLPKRNKLIITAKTEGCEYINKTFYKKSILPYQLRPT